MTTPSSPEGFDQQVQAYVDNELAADERAEFRRAMGEDPRLVAEVERLAALRRCLREAYPVEATIQVRRERAARRGLWASAAALLIGIAVGFAGGYVMPSRDATVHVVEAAADGEMTRVLLHVGTGDADAMAEALTSARYILDDFAESDRSVRVHVVANGPGLDIFRSGVSRFSAQIGALERDYSNIQFVACQNTIERVEKKLNKTVRLLPEVLRVDSGVADIARKRASGWLYIGV